MASTDQPCREQNIEAITKYITRTMIPNLCRVGIKLEHFIIHSDDGSRVSYTEDNGIADILEELAEDYSDVVRNSQDQVIRMSRNYTGVTEEVACQPGGQIQYCAGPFINTEMANTLFENFENALKDIIEPKGMQILAMGYGLNEEAMDVELVPYEPYKAMDKYFLTKSGYGMCMMRNMAATQISIDYSSEEDCIHKLRLASALAPILSLLADNSIMFEAEPREHHMVRSLVWNAVDRDRVGTIPGLFDEDFTLAKYAEYVLDTPAIVYKSKGKWVEDTRTFGEIYADKAMKTPDVEHALSMVLPDARLTNFVEIRTPDALPWDFAVAFATFVKGLFSSQNSLNDLDRMFGDVTERDIQLAKLELMSKGFDATVYGKPVSRMAEQLHITSKLNLNREDQKEIEELTTLCFQQATLAGLTMIQ